MSSRDSGSDDDIRRWAAAATQNTATAIVAVGGRSSSGNSINGSGRGSGGINDSGDRPCPAAMVVADVAKDSLSNPKSSYGIPRNPDKS